MKDLLLEMKAYVEQAKASGLYELDRPLFSRLLRRYDEILAEGYQGQSCARPTKEVSTGQTLAWEDQTDSGAQSPGSTLTGEVGGTALSV